MMRMNSVNLPPPSIRYSSRAALEMTRLIEILAASTKLNTLKAKFNGA